MQAVSSVIRSHGYFVRRSELLGLGFTDARMTAALAGREIFRVRQGWYSVPDAPDNRVRAVRVGGRLTSLSALEDLGLPVPRQPLLHVAVRGTASRLRTPLDRRVRLGTAERVAVHWVDTAVGGTPWRVSVPDAILAVLVSEGRDVAIACCSAALRTRLISTTALSRVFEAAPLRTRSWQSLVSLLDGSHGETFARLWLHDVGVKCEQQVAVPGVGRLDFRLSAHVYLEIDGGQHDPAWTGEGVNTWESDHDRDTSMAIRGDRVLRVTYRQLYTDWPRVVAGIKRAIADDVACSI